MVFSISLLVAGTGFSQGFVNLNFGSANIVTDLSSPYPNGVYANNAMPGWSAFVGTNLQTSILYNDIALSETSIAIFDTNGYYRLINGTYTIDLFGGLTDIAASISQTGLVPTWANTLEFEAQPGLGTLQISLGGQILNFSALATGSDYTLYGANISAFAGQTEQLMFSALEGGNNYWNIGDIQFSSNPAPEPGIWSLSTLGVLILACRHRRKSPAA